jgi:2-iminobutanoate/2-iminopropanoate deaminase
LRVGVALGPRLPEDDMRRFRCAIVLLVLTAGLAAQSGNKQFVRPLPGQTPPYSLGITAGGVIYVAGQLPTDAKGAVVQGDITVQAKQVFDNLRAILKQAGSSLDHAVSAVVMLQNASDFAALDQFYRQQFTGDPPARTTIIGQMVRPGALVEIAVTAVPATVPRTAILPAGWMKPASPYSYAIKAGDTLYLSGLVSRNGKDNAAVPGDITVQTKTIMDNAGEILKAAGMSYADIAAARIALRDHDTFAAMNKVYASYWEKDRPARITTQSAPPGTFDIEITFVAITGSAAREAIIPPRPDGTPGQVNPNFSPAIRVGNRLFTSAGIGSTEANAGDMKAQTTEALTRLGLTLKAAGFDYKDVVSSDVFITDVAKFNDMNEGYRPFFATDPPVRATVGVDRFANTAVLMEIVLTAVKN